MSVSALSSPDLYFLIHLPRLTSNVRHVFTLSYDPLIVDGSYHQPGPPWVLQDCAWLVGVLPYLHWDHPWLLTFPPWQRLLVLLTVSSGNGWEPTPELKQSFWSNWQLWPAPLLLTAGAPFCGVDSHWPRTHLSFKGGPGVLAIRVTHVTEQGNIRPCGTLPIKHAAASPS